MKIEYSGREAEESQMLETAARKLLVETEQAAKLRGCCGDL
jgi:hypothetical protein